MNEILKTIMTEACSALQFDKNPRKSLMRIACMVAYGENGDSEQAEEWLRDWLARNDYPEDLLLKEMAEDIVSHPIKPQELIGMKVDEASKLLQSEGLGLRVTRRNGMNLIGTANFDTSRINVAVDDDVIVSISGCG